MGLPVPNLVVAKGLVSIPHTIAIIVTIFRVFDRWRMRRMWWDDYWALIALVFNIPNWISFLLRPPSGSGENYLSIRSRVIIYWLSLLCFPLTLWSARISIGVSSVRVLPPGATMRKVAFYMNILLGLMCAGIIIQRTWICGHDSSWHANPGVQCFLPPSVGINNLVTDILADVMLIAAPLKMLWNVKLPYNLRRVVLSIFAASIFTTLASIIYAIFLFRAKTWGSGLGLLVAITSHLEATVALIVCNLLVVVTFFYRVYRNGEDIESYYPSSTATSQPSHELQTQRITGVPRTTLDDRIVSNGQTVTASIAFTDISGMPPSDYYGSSADSSRVGEKTTLDPITQ